MNQPATPTTHHDSLSPSNDVSSTEAVSPDNSSRPAPTLPPNEAPPLTEKTVVKKLSLTPILIFLLFGILIITVYWFLLRPKASSDLNLNSNSKETTEVTPYSKIPEVAFVEEVYQVISDNYWKDLSDEGLSQLFLASFSRIAGTQPELNKKNRDGVAKLVEKVIKDKSKEDKEKLLTQVVDVVLQNLEPTGRSRLYSEQDKTKLQETVSNIDPKADLFKTLDTSPDASDEAVSNAYQKKKAEVEQNSTNSAQLKQELAQIERAYQAVGTKDLRERYAKSKVEPTIIGQDLGNNVYYIDLNKFSPTTVEDFRRELAKLPKGHHFKSLIFDLRGNQGGAIDGLPYFLGPFIGNNQYGYQFFSQGKTLDFKTKVGRLPELEPFKRIVVLVDGQTQSSAEAMAAALKKYNVGVLVGSTTRGWGTVERVFPLEHQLGGDNIYSVFLVHSLTLDENGEPIEGKGVIPSVNIKKSGWQRELLDYFNDQNLVGAVEKLVKD